MKYIIWYTSSIGLEGCSSLSSNRCTFKNNIILEEIGEMKDTEDCQYMCSEIYLGVCKYFLHDIKMQICYILHSTDIDTCNRISGGITTNIENCVETFEDDNESISCLVSLISMEVFDDTLH